MKIKENISKEKRSIFLSKEYSNWFISYLSKKYTIEEIESAIKIINTKEDIKNN